MNHTTANDPGTKPVERTNENPVLITGGFGFIGTNLADRLLSMGKAVHLFDNLSRPGAERNLYWLRNKYGGLINAEPADVRDYAAIKRAVDGASQVFHFAAQVAVTRSVIDPIHDFHVNVQGTMNVLEAVRTSRQQPPLVFTSTNKVYGALRDVSIRMSAEHYEPVEQSIRLNGINEEQKLDFCSPYGCSKGSADQYVLDYARTYSIPAVVFRMSCIYGHHQMGTEDQGWVAHFILRALRNRPITIYGDGRQVRDCLFAQDLVDAFLLAQQNMDSISGEAFNIGGGTENALSLLSLIRLLEERKHERIQVQHAPWRIGDQRYYVSDTTKFRKMTGWKPSINIEDGIGRLYRSLAESDEFSRVEVFSGKVAI